MKLLLMVAAAAAALVATVAAPALVSTPPPPVVLIPGIGGNRLEVRLSDDYHGSALYCRTFGLSYWFRLWLNVLGIAPPFTRCFAERIRLEYNAGSKKFHNPPGIETRVPGFGSTETMEYLDPTFKFLSSYMAPLVKSLKSKGLESGKTLFGAPYDFRYAPGPNAADVAIQFLKDLKHLIEQASSSNGDEPVVLVAHSLGGLWVLHFLNLQSIEWKRRYVARFIAIATPWGGSVQEMRVFASGYAEGVNVLDPLVLRYEQRSTESNLWLLPVPKVFRDEALVVSSSRNYSSLDLQDFFQDIGFPQGFSHYQTRVPELCDSLSAPLVPVTLIFGFGVDTPNKLLYTREKGFDYEPEVEFGDGDGTINLCSLEFVISQWSDIEEQTLKVIRIRGQTHSSILGDQEAVDQIVEEVLRRIGQIREA